MLKKIISNIVVVLIAFSSIAFSQSLRNLVNKGVDLYKDGKHSDAEVNFKKGLEMDPKNYITNFNLGDAYFKQQKFDEAIKSYQKALTESKTDKQKASVYHNIGNTFLKDKKLDQSIAAYKQALKLNPDDHDTKYNLSYALSQKNDQKNNKNNDKNNKDKNNKDKDNQQNKDKDKNDKQDQKNQQNEQNKNVQNKQNQKQQQPQKNQISKADAERILNALKNNEQDLQKKLRKKTGKVVKTEKDW